MTNQIDDILTITPQETIFKKIKFMEYINLKKLNIFINSDKLNNNWYIDNINDFPYTSEKEHLMSVSNDIKDNILYVNYKKSIKNKYGRVYPLGSRSLGSIRREVRHFISAEYYEDIDIQNTEGNILNQMFKKNKVLLSALNDYCENRNDKINYYTKFFDTSKDNIKDLFIALMNKGSINNWFKKNDIKNMVLDQFLTDFQDDINTIATRLKLSNSVLYKKITKEKDYNPEGSLISIFFQEMERRILEHVYIYLNEKYNIGNKAVLCFDGIMILKEYYNDNILTELNKYIYDKMKLNLIFTNKKMNENIFSDLDLNISSQINLNIPTNAINRFNINFFKSLNNYQEKKLYFERFVCKILCPDTFYIFKYNKFVYDSLNFTCSNMAFTTDYSVSKLKDAFCNLYYDDDTDESKKKKSFINSWIEDENIKCFDYIDFIPHNIAENKMNDENNNDYFNCFKGYNNLINYHVENIETEKEKKLKLFNKIGLELCGGNQEYYNYLFKFFSHMIQFPGVKVPLCIIIKGSQGVGKNVWLNAICNLLNQQNYIISSNPNDFLGEHSEGFENKILINLNEADGKDTFGFENQIKSIITEDKITVNPKFIRPYQVKNVGRLIIFTNKSTPMPIDIKSHDRRFVVFEATDYFLNKKFDGDFWRKAIKHFSSPEFIACLYNAFNNVDLSDFKLEKERPLTDAYKKMIRNFIPSECLFLEDYINTASYINKCNDIIISDDIDDETKTTKYLNDLIKIKGSDIYEDFILYLKDTGLYRDTKNFKPSTKSFYQKLEDMKIPLKKRLINGSVELNFLPIQIIKFLIKNNWVLNDYSDYSIYNDDATIEIINNINDTNENSITVEDEYFF